MKTPDFSFITNPEKHNSLTMILFSLIAGTVIAAFGMLYRQLVLGGIVRRIIAKDALSEEKAKTVEELNYSKKNLLVKFALRKKSTFSKVVLRTEDDPPKYYIPEEKRMKEEIRFRKKGNSIFTVILMIAAFIGAAYLLLNIIPVLTENAKSIFD
ncbi:MAG: hypothetical protein IJN17_07345 [Clostridia bacterium]|nr:hypothetical protein [Oscillospiraceae bacterium]MBQ6702750.1 hypothetical protein [Clostridia bacterium]